MEYERITEFTRDGKNFIYIDFSGMKKNDVFVTMAELAKQIIGKYHKQSVYTITNIANIVFDTESKKLVASYMKHNAPYVKCGAIIGSDGAKKTMLNAIFKLSGRKPLKFFYTKDKAIEWLLQQE